MKLLYVVGCVLLVMSISCSRGENHATTERRASGPIEVVVSADAFLVNGQTMTGEEVVAFLEPLKGQSIVYVDMHKRMLPHEQAVFDYLETLDPKRIEMIGPEDSSPDVGEVDLNGPAFVEG